MLVKRFLTHPHGGPQYLPLRLLGLSSRRPVWLYPVGASQFLKGFLQHLGSNGDQILTSENPQLRPEAQDEDRSCGAPPPCPKGLPFVRAEPCVLWLVWFAA